MKIYNKILAFVMAMVMCASLCACIYYPIDTKAPPTSVEKTATPTPTPTPAPEKTVSTSTPLLYKVSDNEGNVIWLFGSIHVGISDYYPLPDYVLDAFDNSDGAAFEFDIITFENDLKTQMEALSELVYTDGTDIKDHVPSDVYNDAVEILKENGLNNAMLNYYNASFWSSYIDNCLMMQLGIDTELGVDLHLIKRAYSKGIDVLEIESAAFQYGIMAEFSQELQAYLLKESIDNYNNLDEAKADIEELINLWQEGDREKLYDYLSVTGEFESKEEEALYNEYNNAMMVERNISMTKYAENALKSGKEIFICVGAAHVTGKGSISEELEKLGYTVEVINS